MSDCPRCADLERALSESVDTAHAHYQPQIDEGIRENNELRAYAEECRRAGKWALDLVTDWVPTDRYDVSQYTRAVETLRGHEIVHPHPLYVGDELDAMAEAIDQPERSHAVGALRVRLEPATDGVVVTLLPSGASAYFRSSCEIGRGVVAGLPARCEFSQCQGYERADPMNSDVCKCGRDQASHEENSR